VLKRRIRRKQKKEELGKKFRKKNKDNFEMSLIYERMDDSLF
jgi:hypothetical protein